jgi:hypothetical protein
VKLQLSGVSSSSSRRDWLRTDSKSLVAIENC